MKKEKGINPFHEIIKMLFLIECEKERQGNIIGKTKCERYKKRNAIIRV